MKLLCALGGHEAGEHATYFGGCYFSHCRRCGSSMIRSGASWRAASGGRNMAPKGGSYPLSEAPIRLPAVPAHRRSNRPAADLLPRGAERRGQAPASAQSRRTNAAAVPMPRERYQPRYLLALAALLGAGLQLALSLRDLRSGF